MAARQGFVQYKQFPELPFPPLTFACGSIIIFFAALAGIPFVAGGGRILQPAGDRPAGAATG